MIPIPAAGRGQLALGYEHAADVTYTRLGPPRGRRKKMRAAPSTDARAEYNGYARGLTRTVGKAAAVRATGEDVNDEQ